MYTKKDSLPVIAVLAFYAMIAVLFLSIIDRIHLPLLAELAKLVSLFS